ncbi:hypothetical protein GCK72_013105 [Caenorhabditis remanei]|uniref:Uncharacterized protein n=1 Tax=Caenorhabditis remanei TaxID=31234 RepID=A0A6A5GPQ0_CAERE|nr:hypothetical protein GCK72_013105 [Caenorhabditis remanei]KAF1756651.1 hypothetical protein GCK72_013105 [Caenorhabditis remanei]
MELVVGIVALKLEIKKTSKARQLLTLWGDVIHWGHRKWAEPKTYLAIIVGHTFVGCAAAEALLICVVVEFPAADSVANPLGCSSKLTGNFTPELLENESFPKLEESKFTENGSESLAGFMMTGSGGGASSGREFGLNTPVWKSTPRNPETGGDVAVSLL